jgi:hypothetical protein
VVLLLEEEAHISDSHATWNWAKAATELLQEVKGKKAYYYYKTENAFIQSYFLKRDSFLKSRLSSLND